MSNDIHNTVTEAIEQARAASDAEQARQSRLNTVVALAVAVSATCMALCNVKDGNVVQAMAQAQSNSVNAWGYYQAKSTKQYLAEAMVDQLSIERDACEAGSDRRRSLEARVDEYQKRVARYEVEKAEIKKTAEDYLREYDRLNVHDDQLDMAEAGFSISIALFGVTALTQKRWLLAVAAVFALFGAVFGLAGFLRWGLHPDLLAKILS